MTERFGAVRLPSQRGVKVFYDPSSGIQNAQQVQAQELASFEALPNDNRVNGSVLDVNQHFIVYAVKKGLIRVLHKHSSLRSLLRAHEGKQVTDMSFFENGDVLGTVGGSVLIWRIFERSPEIVAEKLLEIPDTINNVLRLIWHPFNPNQFWLIHENDESDMVATLVETTRISTVRHHTGTHAVAEVHNSTSVMAGALQLCGDQPGSNLTDLCWSGRDARHVLTSHDDGTIRLWDTKDIVQVDPPPSNETVRAKVVRLLREDETVTMCFFLPHDNVAGSTSSSDDVLTNTFLTATKGNSCITLWSPFLQGDATNNAPSKLQVLCVDELNPSYNLITAYGQVTITGEPPASFVLLSDRNAGRMFAVHMGSVWSADGPGSNDQQHPKRPLLTGFDYVVPFRTSYPTYSWSVVCAPAEQLEDHTQGGLNFDVRFHALQSQAVQQLSLQHFMCLPPVVDNIATWDPTPGVRTEALSEAADAATTNAFATVNDEEFDDYDVADDDDDDQGDDSEPSAPEPSALPPPGLIGGDPSTTPAMAAPNNPFANWLGAMAAKATTTGGIMTEPPSQPQQRKEINPSPPPPGLPPPTPAVTPATGLMTTTLPPGLLEGVNIPNLSAVVEEQQSAPPDKGGGAVAPPGPPLLNPIALLDGALGDTIVTETQQPQQQEQENVVVAAPPPELPTPPPAKPTAQPQHQPPKQAAQPQQQSGGGRPTSRKKSPQRNKGKHRNKSPPRVQILKRGDQQQPSTPTSNGAIPLSNNNWKAESSSSNAAVGPSIANMEASIKTILAQHLKQHEKHLLNEVQRTVRTEFQTHVLPEMTKSIEQTLAQSVVRPMQSSMETALQKTTIVNKDAVVVALSTSVQEPLQEAFMESMKTSVIPAYEAATREMFSQVAAKLAADDGKTAALSAKLDSMAQSITALTAQVADLKTQVAQRQERAAAGRLATGPLGSAPPPPPVDPMFTMRNEILGLLKQRDYEKAFTKALSASTAEMAVFCCKHADLSDCLGGAAPSLSQPILLCLMQQLGAVLPTSSNNEDVKMELKWIQEIALSLVPSNPNIARHVPGVLQQLEQSINIKMAQGDPTLRRPLQMLQQVLRGMARS